MPIKPANADERWLAAEVAAGRVADFTVRSGNEDELIDIRGEFLRELALSAMRPAGLGIRGSRITGILDLRLCELSGPLLVQNCVFTAPLDIAKALLIDIDLSGSHLPGLDGTGSNVKYDLTFISGRVTGPTALINAVIGGQLDLTGSNFINPEGNAIDAGGARIHGDIFCKTGFRAEGEVLLRSATVGGQLVLTGGTFTNPNGRAIYADAARIGGGMFCRTGFRAEGEVRLLGATIDQLELTGGTFANPHGDAINADRIQVNGNIVCRAGFRAEGEVRLLGATIGGQLSFTGGTFTNPDDLAISMDGAQIDGDMVCRAGFRAEGGVRLLGATIGGQLDLTGGTFTNPLGYAIVADGAQVKEGLLCGAGFRAEGEVRLLGASIPGQLSLSECSVINPDGFAITADIAQIGVLRLTHINPESSGKVSLIGSHTGYLADDASSWQQFSIISLLDFTYDRVANTGWSPKSRVRWLKQDPEYRAQPYEHLAHTLRSQGHEREARDVMIAKNRRRRQQLNLWRRLPEYLFDGLLAYGYRPLQRTLPALILLYAVGVFLFNSARHDHAVIATRAPIHQAAAAGTADRSASARPIVATTHCPPDYPCFSPWAYTADVLIPLISTHQTDFWAVSGSTKVGFRTTVYSWIASALGWVLTTAAALGFTGLIRRD
ncbi:hypothetical protein [Jatrophihabitans sp.]|uniref:hypothetical protein n=1 Tax=Jatrophihabitans sp. TaxID=1932789 RepID=UPI002CDC43CC|nr:hypothetical protein [Jatrophihabitans sp.]